VFDEEGVTFELAPITVLTGCNSSGKSSVVKSRILLSDYLKKVKHDYFNENHCNLEDYRIDFTQGKHKLGSFDKALNFKAKKGSKISFKYSVESLLLAEEVEVELTFKTKKEDELNNGWLSDITISKANGDILLLAKVNKEGKLEIEQINLFRIKQNFIDFSVMACELSSIERFFNLKGGLLWDIIEGRLSDSEIETQIKELREQIYELKKIGAKTVMKACLKWHYNTNSYSNKTNFNVDYDKWDLVRSIYENRTFFYMPIFEWLKDVPKDKVRLIIEQKVYQIEKMKNDEKNELVFHLNRIIEDFEKSNYECFIDYFLSFENDISFSKGSIISLTLGRHGKSFVEMARNAVDICISVDPFTSGVSLEGGEVHFFSDPWKKEKINFKMIYAILMALCWRADAVFEQNVCHDLYGMWHQQYTLFQKYFEALIEELIINASENITNTEYVDSSRIDVQRLYTFESKDKEFNKLLIEYFDAKRLYLRNKEEENKFSNSITMYDYEPNSFINRCIKEFQIGDSLEIKSIENGLGIIINLYKNNKVGLLSDEGYGITQIISSFLRIEIAILKAERYKRMVIQEKENNEFNYRLDIHFPEEEESDFRELCYKPTMIYIEEPEIHLHPALQSKLAEMFLYAYKKYNIRFIVETHSEYLVRKLQTLVAKKEIKPDDVSLYYLYDPNPEKRPTDTPQVKKINIKEDGRLDDTFGGGFFDEADNMAMDLLSIKLNH
jgi:predicted ATP-dependent endonuclease of OLD family